MKTECLLFHDAVTIVYVFDRRPHENNFVVYTSYFFLSFQSMGPYCSHLDFRAKLIFLPDVIVPHDFAKSLGVLYGVKKKRDTLCNDPSVSL